MAKFRWEHGIQEHRLPLTEDLLRLIGINEHDENIQDTITKQATTLPFDRKAILHVGIAQATYPHPDDPEHDLAVKIARGGELLGDFYARHFQCDVLSYGCVDDNMISIRCYNHEEALTLSKESLVQLED